MPFHHPSTMSELVQSIASMQKDLAESRRGLDGGGGAAAAALIGGGHKYADSEAWKMRQDEAKRVIDEISSAMALANRRLQDLGILTKSAVLAVADKDSRMKANASAAAKLRG